MASNQPTSLSKRISPVVLAVYWVALFVATHIPPVRPLFPNQSDKVMHFVAFAGLAGLFAWTWSLRAAFGWRQGLAVLAILAVYGSLDEFTQTYVGRHAHVADWIADVAGASCGLAAFAAARGFFRQRA